jgi:peptidoglycan/LPS O-acetylase OafA/YrhL/lysophospholipase L1-like esterase
MAEVGVRSDVPESLRYLPALDGLRAAAVLAVMLYHGGVAWMRGGYLGVDAFFVLSGFLITALLLTEWRATKGIAFARFWARRARRLLPALGLVVLAIILYGAFLAPTYQLDSLRADTLSTLGYVTNWRLIFSGQGYFDQFAVPSPLRHAWSLAIEEQFYLVWPLVVYALCRWARLSWRAMATLFGGLAIASAGLMAMMYERAGVTRAYYGTDTRAQALLVGATLAVLYVSRPSSGTDARGVRRRSRRRRRRAPHALSIAAFVAVAVTAWLWTTAGDGASWLYQGGYLLAAVSVAVVIARVVQIRTGLLGAVLSVRSVRWVGQISYGLYLWHWPIYVVLTTSRVGLDGTALLLARLAATFAVATASYYLIELPVRRGALQGRRGFALVPMSVGALVAALVLVTSDAQPVIASGNADRAALADVRSANRDAQRTLAHQRDLGAASRTRSVLVVGDSVALTLGLGLQETSAPNHLVVVNKSKMGCGIIHGGDVWVLGRIETIRDDCGDWALRWAASVRELHPDLVLLLIGAWDAYDRRIDGAWIPFGSPQSDDLLRADLQGAVDVITRGGTRLAFATVPYYDDRYVVNRPSEFRSAFDPARVDHLNQLIREVARANRDRVEVLDLNGVVTGAALGGESLQDDGVHFGADNRRRIAALIAPRLHRLAAEGAAAPATGSAPPRRP